MFREAIRRMTPYRPGEQPRPGQRLIKLNTNENPYSPSPRVRRAVVDALSDALRLYPSPRADEFLAAASRLYEFPPEMIIAGNGSDELLAMLFRAALGRRDKVAYALPTYSLYDTLAAVQEAKVVAIPLDADFAIPFAALAREKARLTIVCSPNSPSGTLAAVDDLARLAGALEGRILAVDEAYVDFADYNALHLVKQHDNVVVLRSLSKSFSLAGMRLGLGFARASVVEDLLKVKDSYNLNRLAVTAGAAALADAQWMRRNVERVKRTRAATSEKLKLMGFEVPESQANFVFARIAGQDMAPVAAALRRRGILVRHFPGSVFSDAIRITIGTPAEMDTLLKVLEHVARPILPNYRNGSRRRQQGA
jgi:histidinol-phosphate aminotransferase